MPILDVFGCVCVCMCVRPCFFHLLNTQTHISINKIMLFGISMFHSFLFSCAHRSPGCLAHIYSFVIDNAFFCLFCLISRRLLFLLSSYFIIPCLAIHTHIRIRSQLVYNTEHGILHQIFAFYTFSSSVFDSRNSTVSKSSYEKAERFFTQQHNRKMSDDPNSNAASVYT